MHPLPSARGLAAAVLLLPSATLLAQERDASLEEVTVLGQKIERSRQDTIESVTVFTADYLENSTQIFDLYDVLDQTPNAASFGTYDYTIRGVTTGGQSFSPQLRTIGVFVDGALTTSRAAQRGALSTWDLAQAEILKGPQSTNQGRNSMAGAIVLRSGDPEFEFGTRLRGGYGDFGTSQIAGMVTGPITDSLAFRISVDQRNDEGFVRSAVFGNDDFDRERATTVRGKLLKTFDNGARVTLTLSASEYDDDGVDNVTDYDPINDVFFDPRERLNFDNFASTWITESQLHSLNISIPLSDRFELTALTGFAQEDFKRDSDIDGFMGDSILDLLDEETEINQELRISYSGERLDAVFGVYYAGGNRDSRITTTDFAVPLGGPLVAVLDFTIDEDSEYENFAVFANADFQLTERLKLVGGLRWDNDNRENAISNDVVIVNDVTPFDDFCIGSFGITCNDLIIGTFTGQLGPGSSGSSDLSEVFFRGGLDYQWTDDIATALTFSQGYRPGGVSTNPVRASALVFDAEFTENYEFSLRTQWLNQRLTVNANVFYTDWTDQQITVLGDLGPFDSDVFNAGASNLRGVEVEASYAATRALSFIASVGAQETEFDDFVSGPDQDFTGNQFPGAPGLTSNFTAEWRPASGVFGRMNVNYVGDLFLNADNVVEIADRTIVNLSAGFSSGRWSGTVFVNNLFDRDFLLEEFANPVGRNLVFGDRRVVGARIEWGW